MHAWPFYMHLYTPLYTIGRYPQFVGGVIFGNLRTIRNGGREALVSNIYGILCTQANRGMKFNFLSSTNTVTAHAINWQISWIQRVLLAHTQYKIENCTACLLYVMNFMMQC
jgi:hypothetical protein